MKHVLLVFLFGAFTSLSMAPYSFTPALFIGLSALYICVERAKTAKFAACLSYMFSFGYFAFGLSWVGEAFLVEDNPYWWVWPFAISGLPLILSFFSAFTIYVYKRCEGKLTSSIMRYLGFCLALFFAELMRGTLFTGFPWNLYGYSWISNIEIAQIASLHNIYLLTLIAIFWAVAPAFIIKSKHPIPLTFLLTCSIIGAYLFGMQRITSPAPQQDGNIEFIIVQPNIKQSEKWLAEKRAENFLKLLDLSKHNEENSKNAKAYYIIWPETALAPDLLGAPWAIAMIRETLQSYPAPAYLITGALRHKSRNYYNSILIFDHNAAIIHSYNKHHLVPFGEYIPFDTALNISPVVGFSGFIAGEKPKPVNMPEGFKILPLICYEIIFPAYSINNKADIIINSTNDAWYGDSAGPYQHLVQTQFRAIETKTPILRSANTGISAAISPFGQLIQIKDLNKKGRILEKTLISVVKVN